MDWSYGEFIEMLSMGFYDDFEDVGESSGVYIVCIFCGFRYFVFSILEILVKY